MKVEKLFWIVVSLVIIAYIFIIHPSQANDIWATDNTKSRIKAEEIKVDTEKTLTYIYNTHEELEGTKSIMILRNHIELRILIDGTLVSQVMASNESSTKTTGKGWTILPLKEEYLNKQIQIELIPIYDSAGTARIYQGDSRKILKGIFVKDVIEVLVVCILGLMSILLIIIARSDIGGRGSQYGLYYLGCMAFAVAGWRIGEINTLRLILPYDVGWSNASYICLGFMPLTFAMYFRTVIGNKYKRVIDIFCIGNIIIIISQLILQLVGKVDYRQSVGITYFIIVILIIIVIGIYITDKKSNRQIKSVEFNRDIFLIMATIALTSLILYIVTGTNSNIVPISVVFYILILAFNKMEQIRKQSLKKNELEVYRQLAFVEEMTGLYNRTALEHDLRLYNQKKIERLTGADPFDDLIIIVVDLNDLKLCNDKYGHEKGDAYIRDVSKVINDIFADSSKCYRMGGDEFCIIGRVTTSIKINKRINEFKYSVDLLNNDEDPFTYRIAVGYAQYDGEIDNFIEDIMKRADANMYAHKRFIKDTTSG